MEKSKPVATAVAVSQGRIVSVGSLETLKDYIVNHGATVDRQFEQKVLAPGFIDPHIHPSLPAVLTQFAFLAPDDWKLPTGIFPGATTHDTYIARLQDLVVAHQNAKIYQYPLILNNRHLALWWKAVKPMTSDFQALTRHAFKFAPCISLS